MEDEELLNTSPSKNTSPTSKSKTKPLSGSDLFYDIHKNKGTSKYQTKLGTLSREMSATYHGQNTGLGKSKYDEGVLWDSDIDEKDIEGSINENRYKNQGWGTQLGAGLARAGVKAASEIFKLPGVVVGGVLALGEIGDEKVNSYDTIFNNKWIKSLDKINEEINTELLPVYVGKAIKEGNLWDNITSTSFWATEGADGLGYMVGMMAPGAFINRLGLGAKLINGTFGLQKRLKMTSLIDDAIGGLNKVGLKGAKTIDMGTGVAVNTIAESGAEAKSVGDQMDAQKPTYLQNYPALKLKKLQEIDVKRRNNEITIDEANQMSDDVSNMSAEDSFNEQRALAMRDNFKMNLGILLVPNLLMHKAVWGRPAKKVEAIVEKTGKAAILQRAGQSAKRWGTAFASEGFLEEAGQSTSEKMFTEKAMRNELGRKQGFFGDFSIGDLTNGYLDTVSSTEGQKAIFLGGMMGGPMMSYQGHKEDVNNRKESNAILDETNKSINGFNTIFNNDIYKKRADGSPLYETDELGNEDITKRVLDPEAVKNVALAYKFTEDQSKQLEEAVENGDHSAVEVVRQKAVFDLILPAISRKNGGLDVMKQQLEASTQFQEIIERDNDPETKQRSIDFVKETLETAKYLQEQNEKFDNFGKDVITLDDSRGNKQDKEKFLEYLNTRYLQTKFEQRNSEKSIKELEEQRKQLYDELDLDESFSPYAPVNFRKMFHYNTEVGAEAKEQYRNAEEDNPRLAEIQEEIVALQESVAKNKKDVAEIWKGGNKIEDSYSKYLDKQIAGLESSSAEKIKEADDFIESVKRVNTDEELAEIVKNNPELIKNPALNKIVAEKEIALQEEKERKEEELSETNSKISEETEPDDNVGTSLGSVFGEEVDEEVEETEEEEVVEPVGEEIVENIPIVLPTPGITPTEDVVLDGDPTTIASEEIPVNNKEQEKKKEEELKKIQPGAKMLSTIRKKNDTRDGKKLEFISQEFLDYERNGKNKIGKIVNFKLGDYAEGNSGKALNILNDPSKRNSDDLDFLYKYLPISTAINVDEGFVESFIESYPHESSRQEAFKAFNNEVLPLRISLIDAILVGNDISKISSKIVKQFPGVLKVEPQIALENGTNRTPTNSVADLHFFKNFKGNLLLEIAKRAYYVGYDGALTSVLDKNITKGDLHLGLGEVFIEIPQANGENFNLKLNYKTLEREKGEAIFEMVKVLSTLTPTIDNPNPQSMSIVDFLQNLSDDMRIDVQESLAAEIKLVNDLHENRAERTVQKLLSYLIHQDSKNPRTLFKMNKRGDLVLGTIFKRFMPGANKITKEQLQSNDPQYKEALINFLELKKHNVLITKDNKATFNNPIYLKYILDNDILSTNAVVEEPTFQGYSNMYIDRQLEGISIQPVKTKSLGKGNKKEKTVDNSKINSDESNKFVEQLIEEEYQENSLRTIIDPKSDKKYLDKIKAKYGVDYFKIEKDLEKKYTKENAGKSFFTKLKESFNSEDTYDLNYQFRKQLKEKIASKYKVEEKIEVKKPAKIQNVEILENNELLLIKELEKSLEGIVANKTSELPKAFFTFLEKIYNEKNLNADNYYEILKRSIDTATLEMADLSSFLDRVRKGATYKGVISKLSEKEVQKPKEVLKEILSNHTIEEQAEMLYDAADGWSIDLTSMPDNLSAQQIKDYIFNKIKDSTTKVEEFKKICGI